MAGEGMKDGGPAFPRIMGVELQKSEYAGCPPDVYVQTDDGMSLRDWFAGQAIAGKVEAIASSGPWGTDGARIMAERAYMLADAMLKAREQ